MTGGALEAGREVIREAGRAAQPAIDVVKGAHHTADECRIELEDEDLHRESAGCPGLTSDPADIGSSHLTTDAPTYASRLFSRSMKLMFPNTGKHNGLGTVLRGWMLDCCVGYLFATQNWKSGDEAAVYGWMGVANHH